MKTRNMLQKMIGAVSRVMPGLMFLLLARPAQANPTGMTVVSGAATTQTSGSQLNITTSQSAFLNWQSFNIAAGERTVFNQPSATSIVVNRINDQSASQIYGSLQANGIVILMNSSGFYFGPNSFVSAGGLVVSTANCVPPQNAGGSWEFNGPPPLMSIVNYGSINIGHGGSAYLIADQVENHGDIEAPGGSVGFAAGQTVTLSERPDGRGMSMQVTLPQGSVDNAGNIVADGGTISLNAKVVNQNGLIQANSVQNVNGVIELVASDSLSLGAASQIKANGDDSAAGSAGGQITLKSANTFSDVTGSEISVAGGAFGGNGGAVEISAPVMPAIQSQIDGHAQPGAMGGKLLLDPDYIILDNSGGDSTDGNGNVLVGDNPGGTLDLNVSSAFTGFSQITLQAKYDITLANGTVWDLSGSTGQGSGQLTLQAGGNIIFASDNGGSDNTAITDAGSWSVTLQAGYNFINHSVNYGGGSIYLGGYPDANGNGSIQTAAGNINLEAGQDILVDSGFVRTTGGGNVSAWAHAGNVNTGNYDGGYTYNKASSSSQPFYQVDQNLGVGGISTEAGGNVNITAGGNVTSYMPQVSDTTEAGTGAFGPEPGNVSIVAGGDVTGHYVVANGYGRIYAGAAMVQGNPTAKTDNNGVSINEVDGRGYPILVDANGHAYERDAQGNPVLLDGSGKVIPTTNVKVVSNGTTTDAAGNLVNAYTIEFTLANGTVDNVAATAVGAYALNSASSGSAGVNGSQLALSLIAGGWTVNAADNINLQEVRNPNGIFNDYGGFRSIPPSFHYFDYSPDAYVNLIAGNDVNLSADSSSLPRNEDLPMIFPPILDITAGIGGVAFNGNSTTLGQLILFPSPLGSLDITTSGDLTGNSPSGLYDLIVSDSGYKQYYNLNLSLFGNGDDATTPIHENSPTLVALNVAGDLKNIQLNSPEAAQITVGHDMISSGFAGMNLHASDTTSIIVTGNIENGSDFIVAAADRAPVLQYLTELPPGSPDAQILANLTQQISYDATTKTIVIKGLASAYASDPNLFNELQSLNVLVYQNGIPVLNADGSYKTQLASVIDASTADNLQTALNQQNTQFGSATANNPYGYLLGGGGHFVISANSIDLGTTTGIQSLGVAYDKAYLTGSNYRPIIDANGNAKFVYPLANYFTGGADIQITTVADLNLFSSQISSQNGGAIKVNVGGVVNAGSDLYTDLTSQPRGIFTSGGSDVTVVADGDINVNGSRIAAYDGGNVTVESLTGNVNAGSGAASVITVSGFYVDPATGLVYESSPQIPFSGILALTFPHHGANYPVPVPTLGNILVEAPHGNVNASKAGILQLALNGANYPQAITTVLAGYELRDSGGSPVTAADDASGTPVEVSSGESIDASGSGIVASNARLDASGNIAGLIFARNNINISAQQNINVTALAQGSINVGAGGTVSGTIIGVGGVSASGSSIEASLVSANVTGGTSGSSGLGQGTAANATSQAASANDTAAATAKAGTSTGDDDPLKKKKSITLARKISRVTVLLPGKN